MKKIVACLIGLSCSFTAYASQVCSGNVNDIAVNRHGEVRIKTTFKSDNWFTVCKLDGTWNDISSDTCKVWISELQLGLAANKTIHIYYPDGTSCSDMPYHADATRPDWVIVSK